MIGLRYVPELVGDSPADESFKAELEFAARVDVVGSQVQDVVDRPCQWKRAEQEFRARAFMSRGLAASHRNEIVGDLPSTLMVGTE